MLLNIPGLIIVNVLSVLTGLVIYAYYTDIGCDPLKQKYISNANQVRCESSAWTMYHHNQMLCLTIGAECFVFFAMYKSIVMHHGTNIFLRTSKSFASQIHSIARLFNGLTDRLENGMENWLMRVHNRSIECDF